MLYMCYMCAIWYIYGHPRGILIMNPLTRPTARGSAPGKKIYLQQQHHQHQQQQQQLFGLVSLLSIDFRRHIRDFFGAILYLARPSPAMLFCCREVLLQQMCFFFTFMYLFVYICPFRCFCFLSLYVSRASARW